MAIQSALHNTINHKMEASKIKTVIQNALHRKALQTKCFA